MDVDYKWSYGRSVWKAFAKNRLGLASLIIFGLFVVVGLYAPFFASSKPLVVAYEGNLYFPLLRYLFYPGFYTKPVDLFYNILMFTAPLALIAFWLSSKAKKALLISLGVLQISLFGILMFGFVKDPGSNLALVKERAAKQNVVVGYREDPLLAPFPKGPSWELDTRYMTPYGKISLLLKERQRITQEKRLKRYAAAYLEKTGKKIPTLHEVEIRHEEEEIRRLENALSQEASSYEKAKADLPLLMSSYVPLSHDYLMAKYQQEESALKLDSEQFRELSDKLAIARIPLEKTRALISRYEEDFAKLHYLKERRRWIDSETQKLNVIIPPLIRDFHWEEDAGGAQEINQVVPWWDLSRINRKDLVSGLIFGIRVSILVGVTAIFLSLFIGIPLGLTAGYFGGKTDIAICRLIEVWEAMPTFFMLLLVVAITQSKSIFLVIMVLGLFGWTGFGRFLRGEVLRQKSLPYVTACSSLGFRHPKIMFSHILPNAIPPILTLLPFSMMAAITSEAGLSFLGLGEEGSTSWGVLMDEGRSVFPGESYLLWPPAILLTLLLVSIALIGDALRDALDPKMRSS